MDNKNIRLFKNNSKRDWTDEEWIQEFYSFLQGEIPESIQIPEEEKLKLSANQAYTVLWYLREHFPLLPDFFCKCDSCDCIYNSDNSGYYSEKGNEIGHNFCGACDHLAPYDDEEFEDNSLLLEEYEEGAQNRFRNNDNTSFEEWLENKKESLNE